MEGNASVYHIICPVKVVQLVRGRRGFLGGGVVKRRGEGGVGLPDIDGHSCMGVDV